MNWLDIVLVLIFVMAAIGGARNGLIRSLIGLAALIAGIVLAVKFYPEFGNWMQQFISSSTWSRIVAFAIILIAVVVAGSIIGSILAKLASTIGLGLFDRIGGIVFSLLITAIVFGGIFSLLLSVQGGLGLEGTIRDSALASFLIDKVLPLFGSLSPFFSDPRGWFDGPVS